MRKKQFLLILHLMRCNGMIIERIAYALGNAVAIQGDRKIKADTNCLFRKK